RSAAPAPPARPPAARPPPAASPGAAGAPRGPCRPRTSPGRGGWPRGRTGRRPRRACPSSRGVRAWAPWVRRAVRCVAGLVRRLLLLVLPDELLDLTARGDLHVGGDPQFVQLDPAPQPDLDLGGGGLAARGEGPRIPDVQRPVHRDVAVRLVPRGAGLLGA